MRKQLSTTYRCWTPFAYSKIYNHKETPVDFNTSVSIIEEMHTMMIDHLFKHGRPIQLKASIGYLTLNKRRFINAENWVIDWKKTKEKGKRVRQLNHHTGGYLWYIGFVFASHGRWRMFKFKPLRRHNRDLAKKILNKDVQ